MAWTDAEETRVNTLEEYVNTLSTRISLLLSKEQMRQLLLIKQREIDALEARIVSLETQITTLQNQLD